MSVKQIVSWVDDDTGQPPTGIRFLENLNQICFKLESDGIFTGVNDILYDSLLPIIVPATRELAQSCSCRLVSEFYFHPELSHSNATQLDTLSQYI